MDRHRLRYEDLAVCLTEKQLKLTAEIVGVKTSEIQDFLDAINDVILADPIGTIRRSPNGRVLGVRQASLDEPWMTFAIHSGGGASWLSDPNESVMKWPIIFTPETDS